MYVSDMCIVVRNGCRLILKGAKAAKEMFLLMQCESLTHIQVT